MTGLAPRSSCAPRAGPLGYFAFKPIDATARLGAFVLLKDAAGHEYCGRWSRREQAFVFGDGKRIVRELVSYCARREVG